MENSPQGSPHVHTCTRQELLCARFANTFAVLPNALVLLALGPQTRCELWLSLSKKDAGAHVLQTNIHTAIDMPVDLVQAGVSLFHTMMSATAILHKKQPLDMA